MNLKNVTVDLDRMHKLIQLPPKISTEGSELMRSKNKELRSFGERIYGLAEEMDALLRNCILPFDANNNDKTGGGV
jgi:hypothetical protein